MSEFENNNLGSASVRISKKKGETEQFSVICGTVSNDLTSMQLDEQKEKEAGQGKIMVTTMKDSNSSAVPRKVHAKKVKSHAHHSQNTEHQS